MAVKRAFITMFVAVFWVSNLLAQQPPVITSDLTNESVLTGNTASFFATVSGPGPLTYQWQFNGTNLPNNVIITIAGTGAAGFSGDGGPATNAALKQPSGVAVDVAGNVFISDTYNSRVRKIDTNGIITTVAGNGVFTSSGDGGKATNASMRTPYGLALDSVGNLYIADTNSSRIRMVSTNGIIATVAGTGTNGYSTDGGFATNSNLRGAYGVAVDSTGNLFIADSWNNRIRKVDAGGIITSVAGTNSQNGRWGFLGDGGPATNAMFRYPYAMAVDSAGDIFITDKFNQRIRKVDTNGIISTVAGSTTNDPPYISWLTGSYAGDDGPATNACLSDPSDVIVDVYGNLFIADTWNNRIRKVDTNGIITTVAGKGLGGYSGDGRAAGTARLNQPFAVALDPANNLIIADSYNNRIRKVGFGGSPTLTLKNVNAANSGDYDLIVTSPFGSVTSSIVTLTVMQPPSIIASPQSQTAINGLPASFNVTALGSLPLSYQWQENGTNLSDGGNFSGAVSATLNLAITTTNDDGYFTVIITNTYGSITSSIAQLAVVWSGFPVTTDPPGLSVWQGNNSTISSGFIGAGPVTYQWQFNGSNILNKIIMTVAGNGNFNSSGDGGQATNASFYIPTYVTVDSNGNLLITDQWGGSIRKVETSGVITTIATNLNFPSATALDASGNLFIADTRNNRIRKRDVNGVMTTIAGNFNGYFSGDGDLATNATLNNPTGVALDAMGNLYIADTRNNRIRMVDTDGYINTAAGGGSGSDGTQATNASLSSPQCVVLDASGNLLIAENGRIRKVDTNGIITTAANISAAAFTLDPYGNMFIDGLRIYELDINSNLTLVAGNGSYGFAGDGGQAINATLGLPTGVALDAANNLFIADTGNRRIRKVGLNGSPVLSLNDSNPASAGTYALVVSGAFGSVTSSIVHLTVLIPPSITGIGPNPDGSVTLHFAGGAEQNYLVQAATNLTPPVIWQTVSTNAAGTNGTWQFTDTNVFSYPVRFYRAASP